MKSHSQKHAAKHLDLNPHRHPLQLLPFQQKVAEPQSQMQHRSLPNMIPQFTISNASQSTSPTFQETASQSTPILPSQGHPLSPESLVKSGISYHEAGHLEKATEQFRLAAEMELPAAMFFYGISLRHGWGCKKCEPLALSYLQKAAECAALDLKSLSGTLDTSASKIEFVMAIYEMGVSFRHGWGCKKSKEMAVQFFKAAADLGDADAQNDLAHCYYYGQGVKKDMHMAAQYYRMAAKQGQGIMGNSWIWKPKYDQPKNYCYST